MLFSVENLEKDMNELSRINRADLVHKLVHLPQADYERYMALAPTGGAQDERELSIWGVNNFQMTAYDENDLSECGIALESSRFNHSCQANAHWSWNPHLPQHLFPEGRLLIQSRPPYS